MRNNPLINFPKTSLFCLGCLSALAMAPVYLWPLMVLAYTALTYTLIRVISVKAAFLYTWVFFFGYFSASLYWVSHALTVDIALWWWALPLSFFGLPFLLSLFPAICVSVAKGLQNIFGLPALLTAILIISGLIGADYARSTLFTGFPWNLPAHTWAKTPQIMALLPYIGLFGLNALTIAFFAITAVIITMWQMTGRIIASIAFLIFIGGFVVYWSFAASLLPALTHNSSLDDMNDRYQVHMIQANISQETKWDPKYVWKNFQTYLAMTRDVVDPNGKPALIIWPETATSANFLSYPEANSEFQSFLTSLPIGSILITGFLNSNYRHEPPLHYNSVAVFDTQGNILTQYDKHHLVPFGEYIPYQSLIPIGTVTGFEGFQTGAKPQALPLSPSLGLNILPLICYEIIFPRYVNDKVDNGLVINTTNDAWFGKTAGAYQHFDHAVYRAKESNIPVLRLSGNGISAVIDAQGRVQKATKLNQTAQISLN